MSTATEGIGCTPPDSCVQTGEPTDNLEGGGEAQTGKVCRNGSHQLSYPARWVVSPTRVTFPMGQSVRSVRGACKGGNSGTCGN